MICTEQPASNRVNNVLAAPYIFRGALDVSASAINEKLAAVEAIAQLAREAPSTSSPKPPAVPHPVGSTSLFPRPSIRA